MTFIEYNNEKYFVEKTIRCDQISEENANRLHKLLGTNLLLKNHQQDVFYFLHQVHSAEFTEIEKKELEEQHG